MAHPTDTTPTTWSCAAHERVECTACRPVGAAVRLWCVLHGQMDCPCLDAIARLPPAPVVAPLGRVALGSPADAAALAVLRGCLADERVHRSIVHDEREWSAAVEGHEYRTAQHPAGSVQRATQEARAVEARLHRDLYRALLSLIGSP